MSMKSKNWNSILADNRLKIDAAIDQIFNSKNKDFRFRRSAEQPISKENSGIGNFHQTSKTYHFFCCSVGPIQLESSKGNIKQAEIVIFKANFIESRISNGKKLELFNTYHWINVKLNLSADYDNSIARYSSFVQCISFEE